jgi:hypothetical protein
MKLLLSHESVGGPAIACVTCATHRRPQDVPWNQHAIGCCFRTAGTHVVNSPSANAPTRS